MDRGLKMSQRYWGKWRQDGNKTKGNYMPWVGEKGKVEKVGWPIPNKGGKNV